MDRSWWRILTKRGPLEKGMAIHFSILALKTPWTVWKVKKMWHYITGYHRSFCLVTQSCPVQLSATPCTAAHQASLSFTTSWSLLKFMSIESMMPSIHPFCYSLLLLPSIFPSIRVFSNGSAIHISWPYFQRFSYYLAKHGPLAPYGYPN